MESNVLYFYFLFITLCASTIGVIFSSRMYFAVLSLFLLVCFSGLLYLGFNANYLAIFQFILCGLFLSVYIILLLKKIRRLNLKLKLVSKPKIAIASFCILLMGILVLLFFNQEFKNSLYSVFNFVATNSTDTVKFEDYIFPLSLIGILILVAAAVMRIFLAGVGNDND